MIGSPFGSGGGGGTRIGRVIQGATAGRVLYVGTGGALAQSASLTYNDSSTILTVGTGSGTTTGWGMGYASVSGNAMLVPTSRTQTVQNSALWAGSTATHLNAPAGGAIDFGFAAGSPVGSISSTSLYWNIPMSFGGAAAAATTEYKVIKKVTAIADNTATDVFTVTVPNANHSAAIKVTLLSANGSTDAFESSRVATGTVVLARTTGVNAVAAVSALEGAQIATVAGGATHTLAYDLGAVAGAAGATNTFTIRVTIDDSGNVGANQVVAVAELVNSEATGVTIA